MRIWGNNNAGPTAAVERRGSSSNKVLNSNGLPMDSGNVIPPCEDDMTTDDDDDKYAAQLKQLKQDLMMEGRQDDAPQLPPRNSRSAEQPQTQQRVGGGEKKKQSKKSKKDKSGSGRKAGAAEKEEKRGNTLSRMMFSAIEKEATETGHQDQVKVVYRQFGPDANQVLTVEHDAGGIPSPKSPDHVVVKVQVRYIHAFDFRATTFLLADAPRL